MSSVVVRLMTRDIIFMLDMYFQNEEAMSEHSGCHADGRRHNLNA